MMDPNEDDFNPDRPAKVHCRHFILCKTVWYDPTVPDDFSLGHVVIHLRPPNGSFPAYFERLFAHFQLYGTPGEYRYRIRLVRIDTEGYDGEEEIQLGGDSEPLEWPGSRPVVVSGEDFVDPFAVPLKDVEILEAGVYEFQLWIDGLDETVGRERIQARA